MKDPAFLFYSSDFLSGVIDLDMEERGQYITLLCAQHQKGHLPEKTTRLLVGNCSVSVLAKFEKDSDGNFFNKRLDEEIEKRIKFTESRKKNGLNGGRPRKDNNLSETTRFSLAKPSENLPENENENENKDIIDKGEIEIVENSKKTEAEILSDKYETFSSYILSEAVLVQVGTIINATPETTDKLRRFFLVEKGKEMAESCESKIKAASYFQNWAKIEKNRNNALSNYDRVMKKLNQQAR